MISTGKADWAREVTEDEGSLATYLSTVINKPPKSSVEPIKPVSNGSSKSAPGVFNATDATRISILNGSHTSSEDNTARVLVLPDYKVVVDVPVSKAGATAVWTTAIDPNLGRAGLSEMEESGVKSYVLPYACVILLCESHCNPAGYSSSICPKVHTRKGIIDVILQPQN